MVTEFNLREYNVVRTHIAGENMGEILITFIKQSSAYNLKKAANQKGINAKIIQTPKELSRGGCSYGVVMKRQDMSRAIKLCRDNKIEYRKVFAIFSDRQGNKEYSEI